MTPIGLAESIESSWLRASARFMPRTRQHYRMVAHGFVEYIGDTSADLVAPEHIKNYLDHLIFLGKTARTCNAHLTALKSWFRGLSMISRLPNPAAQIPMLHESRPRRRILTVPEYARLAAYPDSLFHARFTFLAHTGLRVTEFVSVGIHDIDPSGRWITVVGKGNRIRTIPLNSLARQALDYLLSRKKVSTLPMSKSFPAQITRGGIYQQFAAVAKRLSMPVFGPHALRHWFASRMILAGVPMGVVSILLGHSSVRTTEKIYFHIPAHELLDCTECLVSDVKGTL